MASTPSPFHRIDEDEDDQQELIQRQKTRKRTLCIVIPSLVLAAAVVFFVVGVTNHKHDKHGPETKSISSSIIAVCSATLYPDSCYNSLYPRLSSADFKPHDIFKLSVQVAIDELSKASNDFFVNGVKKFNVTDKMTLATIESCHELFSLSLDHFNKLLSIPDKDLFSSFDDLLTWLSSAGTYQQTCIYGLESSSKPLGDFLTKTLQNSTEYTSNSLAITRFIEKSIGEVRGIGRRHLMSSRMPYWLCFKDRKLLQTPSVQINADTVVAQDGSGKYKTITDALNAVPDNSEKRFVIYVKKGVYFENVNVGKSKTNIMIVGDGKDVTIVSASLNADDGTPTHLSATFAVFGAGFIARDIGFRNTAGAAKHQAVALMSNSDKSVFYLCTIDAYQDTLYANSNRQFYRECVIHGTVDFIFGNSPVVIQNCQIHPKKPMPGQQITITAQGKYDPNQNSGISIQKCNIAPGENLEGVSTYLGRPWKDYSTTVYMQNSMDGFINPKGWLPWIGNDAPSTIFYAEYENSGPGAVTTNRVTWKGVNPNIGPDVANMFTVKSFIKGDTWLPGTGVAFQPGLD